MTEDQSKIIYDIRKQFSVLHTHLLFLLPPSRERSIALTELETAGMWAIKASFGHPVEAGSFENQ